MEAAYILIAQVPFTAPCLIQGPLGAKVSVQSSCTLDSICKNKAARITLDTLFFLMPQSEESLRIVHVAHQFYLVKAIDLKKIRKPKLYWPTLLVCNLPLSSHNKDWAENKTGTLARYLHNIQRRFPTCIYLNKTLPLLTVLHCSKAQESCVRMFVWRKQKLCSGL